MVIFELIKCGFNETALNKELGILPQNKSSELFICLTDGTKM